MSKGKHGSTQRLSLSYHVLEIVTPEHGAMLRGNRVPGRSKLMTTGRNLERARAKQSRDEHNLKEAAGRVIVAAERVGVGGVG